LEWECCWSLPEITSRDCPYIAEGEEDLFTSQRKRIIARCLECPRFRNDLLKLQGENNPLSGLLNLIATELLDQKARLHSMGVFLSSKTREMRFLHELSLVLQTSFNLDEVLSVAMTAITAGKGFGLNRALLLMTDRDRQFLRGYLGVGPRNYEEAWQIWREIGENDLSLRELARNFQQSKLESEKAKFHDLLEKLSVPLSDSNHIFNRALGGQKPILVTAASPPPDAGPHLSELLGVDSFLVVPLISRNRRIGIIIADNCITHKPITPQDVQLLETFAFPVAFALERASLHERLQEEVDKLTEANAKLKVQQELILRMEKMALVGQITSGIAHAIRNPLMGIGGLARSLMKTLPETDRNRESLASIIQEAKRLEDALNEALGYADSLHPAIDRWDINQLISGVYDRQKDKLARQGVAVDLELEEGLPLAYIDFNQIVFCIRALLAGITETEGCDRLSLETRLQGDAIAIVMEGNGPPLAALAGDRGYPPDIPGPSENFGLRICMTMLEKQGTPCTVETLPEGGTRYTIKLPIRKENR